MSNPSRPPLPPPPSAPPSAADVVDPAAPFDRVLISVDGSDASLHHHSPSTPSTAALYPQPIRALSLNRLDTMDDSPTTASFTARPTDGTTTTTAGDFSLYRCPSLPGMDRHLSASARTVSTTNLETDLESLSPRVSTTTLSQDLDCRDRFGLSLGSMPSFLARSTSARTIEGLPPPPTLPPSCSTSTGDPPQPPTSLLKPTIDLLATPHVTPHVTAAAAGHVMHRKSYVRVVYRSTSCPTLTDAGRPFFHPGTWVHHHRQRPVLRTQSPRADVNLDGEEIKDLPIEPRKNFPEFSPDLIEGITGSVLKPSYSAQRHRPSQADLDGTAPDSTATTPRLGAEGNARHLPGAVKNCFNIGDVPSSFARPIFAKEQRAPRLVQIKCLQWLNSLDSNR